MLDSGRFIFGPEVEAFEREAAAYLGVPHAIGVANGTDALVLALEAMGVARGDEVICPAFTFYATAEAIARVGATPVFADIDPATLNLDPAAVASLITERTAAIVPVHLFGRPAPLAELAALGVPLLEDAAQAFGAPGIATTGICSTFSFFPTKNLFALGDGGLVVSTDNEVAETVRKLRFHGSRDKQTFELVGTNSRPMRSRLVRYASSCPASRAGTALGARPRRGTWSSGSARRSSCRWTRPGTSTTCTSSDSRARADRRGARGAAIASASYYVPLHLQPAMPTSAIARGRCPRPSAQPPRISRCRCGAGSGSGRSASSPRSGRPSAWPSRRGTVVRSPVSRNSIWQVGVDALLVAGAWWLAWSLRFEHRLVYYDRYLEWSIVALVVGIKLPVFVLCGFYNRWWRYVSTRDMWGAFRGVVLASIAVFLVFTPSTSTAQRSRAASGSSTCFSAWRSSRALACLPAR